jgi:GMP synthase-like glutamine amidotransferase
MRALSITHQRDAGPGVFAEACAAAGVELDEWFVAETDTPPAAPASYDAVFSFGGAMHADHEEDHPWIVSEKELLRELYEQEVPLLGVCLGSQLLAAATGGSAGPASEPEIGWIEVEVTPHGAADPVIGPLAPRFSAFSWHSYECRLPAGSTVLARSPICVQAYRLPEGAAWGIQFHAEVSAAQAAEWIEEYHVDPDAVRVGIDPARLGAESAERIGPWNELGRGLCGRFLEAAAAYSPVSGVR